MVNIRNKSTKIPESSSTAPPPPELIQEDLHAAVVQMDSIESVQSTKFTVKSPEPRSPAPLPEAVSPAGVPIDISSPEMRDICDSPKSTKSTTSRGEFKIDFHSIDAEVDLTMEGKNPGQYKRNAKGSLIVTLLFLVSLHLFLDHTTMFSWVVNYDSPEIVLATVFYCISTMCVMVVFAAALIVPNLSIQEDKFHVYYGTFLVAGGLDLVAVWIAGGIFSPIVVYTLDSMNYLWYNRSAALLTILINGFLYYAFTRKSEDGSKLYSLFHPFERAEETLPAEKSKEIEV